MLEALDRHKRDATLFQITTRQLRDFIDPNHLLIKIDEAFDFAEPVVPLAERYSRDSGRPTVHPEVMVRALLISSLYDITSYRRLVHAVSENIAFRWFCVMGIDEKVFNHSTISVFIERIGRDGFAEIFKRCNRQLLRMGLLSKADALREKGVQRLREEVDPAARRHRNADPDNRLVVDVLEAEWNACLLHLQDAEAELERQRDRDQTDSASPNARSSGVWRPGSRRSGAIRQLRPGNANACSHT